MKNVFEEITKNSTYQGTKLGKTTEQGKKTDDFGDFPIEREAPVTNQTVKTEASGELIFVDGQMIKKPVKTHFGKKGAYEYIKAKRTWRDNLNRRCTIVGDYTPVFNNPIEDGTAPVMVTIIRTIISDDGKEKYVIDRELQRPTEAPHKSVCKEVEIVKEAQTKLFDGVEYRRASEKYTKYATRVCGTEEFERQGTLDQSYSNKKENSVLSWLDEIHFKYMDKAPLEQHQAVLLKKASWVTEIFDDVAYNKVYPQEEVKKGQMKLELF